LKPKKKLLRKIETADLAINATREGKNWINCRDQHSVNSPLNLFIVLVDGCKCNL